LQSQADDDVVIVNIGTGEGPATHRSWIDPSVIVPGSNLTSPLKKAQDRIVCHTPTILSGLATLLKGKGWKHQVTTHRLFLKERNITRIEIYVEYAHVYSHLSFKLQAWEEAEASPEFVMITTLLNTLQLQLKEQIVKNTKLK
jgi:hypothetical protein